MKTKHTPGPWEFRNDVVNNGFYIETLDKTHLKTFIGDVGGGLQSMQEIKANAKLIAAAPEMFEALHSFTVTLDHWLNTGIAADPQSSKAIYDAAKAAIKKATL